MWRLLVVKRVVERLHFAAVFHMTCCVMWKLCEPSAVWKRSQLPMLPKASCHKLKCTPQFDSNLALRFVVSEWGFFIWQICSINVYCFAQFFYRVYVADINDILLLICIVAIPAWWKVLPFCLAGANFLPLQFSHWPCCFPEVEQRGGGPSCTTTCSISPVTPLFLHPVMKASS